jgi:hypothetical protein
MLLRVLSVERREREENVCFSLLPYCLDDFQVFDLLDDNANDNK